MLTIEDIKNRNISISIIGLGYVGLPTAIGFHDAGFKVYGLDISDKLIEELKDGKNPGDDPSLDGKIPNDERWYVTTNPKEIISRSDIIIVTVPTPITKQNIPDLQFVKDAGVSIFDNLNPNLRTVVILESTVYPGVTREIWGPLLSERGLREGVDIDLAYCPERFVPGDENYGVRQVPRVVGSNNQLLCESLVELYSTLTTGIVVPVSSIEIAEASKVIENVQRDLNIALVNELALIFPEIGLDVEEILDAASTKWNFHRYKPGIGVGGHCIPVDPYYLIKKAKESGAPVDLITSARSVNANMPIQVAKKILNHPSIQQIELKNLRIILLGWSYKPGISDVRETPSLPLAQTLLDAGCEVYVWDPLISKEKRTNDSIIWVDNPEDSKADVFVLCTAHDEVNNLDWNKLADSSKLKLIYDGRRVLDYEYLQSLGWEVAAVGKPN